MNDDTPRDPLAARNVEAALRHYAAEHGTAFAQDLAAFFVHLDAERATRPSGDEALVRCDIRACNGEHEPTHPHVATRPRDPLAALLREQSIGIVAMIAERDSEAYWTELARRITEHGVTLDATRPSGDEALAFDDLGIPRVMPAHTIGPDCGPICWTTGHHHDPETCDGCRRLADVFFSSGTALATRPSGDEALRAALRDVESRHRRGDYTEDGFVGNSIDGFECSDDGETWPCTAQRLRLAALATPSSAPDVELPEPDPSLLTGLLGRDSRS